MEIINRYEGITSVMSVILFNSGGRDGASVTFFSEDPNNRDSDDDNGIWEAPMLFIKDACEEEGVDGTISRTRVAESESPEWTHTYTFTDEETAMRAITAVEAKLQTMYGADSYPNSVELEVLRFMIQD